MAVIAGIGYAGVAEEPKQPDNESAIEAITSSIADAGLTLRDIDGLICQGSNASDLVALAMEMGLLDLSWHGAGSQDSSQSCAAVQEAAMAIRARCARVVVVYRKTNLHSVSTRWGSPWASAAGLETLDHQVAMQAHRYMHERRLTNRDLATVVCSSRKYASADRHSQFYGNSFTINDHQSEPWIAEPVLRRADCSVERNADAAVVVTTSERASANSGAVAIKAAARGVGHGAGIAQNYYRRDMAEQPHLQAVLSQLWGQTGMDIHDIDVAMLCDSFSPFIPMGLEELGKVAPKEVAAFVADGEIDVDGELSINPDGGQLSCGYLRGLGGIIEAVRQLRGTATNPVKNAEHVLVTETPVAPSSGLILGRI